MIGKITRLESAKLPILTYVVISVISLYHIDISLDINLYNQEHIMLYLGV